MKKVISVLVFAVMILTLTGCGKDSEAVAEAKQAKANEEAYRLELQQNDYRGGVIRTMALQENVLSLMETMKSNNITIRQENPDTFWMNEGYQDFVTNFLNASLIRDTQWFNEEETDWDTLTMQMVSVDNSFTTLSDDGTYVAKYHNMEITKNEKDDYTITGITGNISTMTVDFQNLNTTEQSYEGDLNYHILYDCDKDWCKSYVELSISKGNFPDVTAQLYEYARIDNDTFAIQTSRERLIVSFKPLATGEVDEKGNPIVPDADLRHREIKEFYYSKLVADGARSSFTAFEPLSEYNADGTYNRKNADFNRDVSEYTLLNEKGDLATVYGVNDSIFLHESLSDEVNRDWVFEETGLQQSMVYKDGALVVTTYNKLSKKYERFIYETETVSDDLVSELENLVDMDKLIGVQEIPETEYEAPEDEKADGIESLEDLGFHLDENENIVDESGNIMFSSKEIANNTNTPPTTEMPTSNMENPEEIQSELETVVEQETEIEETEGES